MACCSCVFGSALVWYKYRYCAAHRILHQRINCSDPIHEIVVASMALSTRYSPYTVSTPRFTVTADSMTSPITSGYSPQHFCSEAASISVAGDGISSNYSMSPLSSPNASPLSPCDFISLNDLLEMSYLSDSCYSASDINSPCHSSEPMTPYDISQVAEETSLFSDPYNSQYCQAGYYSSSSSDLDIYDRTSCPQPNTHCGHPVMPAAAGSSGYSTIAGPSNSSMLPSPRVPYSSQDYTFSNFSNREFMPSSFACATPSESCFSSMSRPSFSSHNMPAWR